MKRPKCDMDDINQVRDLAHELIALKTINQACFKIIEEQRVRIEKYSKRLDALAINQDNCTIKDCTRRVRLNKKIRDISDHGAWT